MCFLLVCGGKLKWLDFCYAYGVPSENTRQWTSLLSWSTVLCLSVMCLVFLLPANIMGQRWYGAAVFFTHC